MMLPSVFGENLFDDVFDDFWGFRHLMIKQCVKQSGSYTGTMQQK